jgi:hypothetical protein
MDLTAFLTQLAENGVAVVSSAEGLTESADDILLAWDAIQRANFPGAAPELIPEAAAWAAARLYRGCQALVCREMPPADAARLLREPCPHTPSPAVDYSVDLVFRFLPDLLTLTRRVSHNDPLVAELLALGQAWPLSSVGMEGIGAVEVAHLLTHPGLRQLYVDRILLTGDVSRLNDAAVRAAAKAALGAYPELAPALSATLNPTP